MDPYRILADVWRYGYSISETTSGELTCSVVFQIIWAKLSDIVGRKVVLMSALLLYTAFSATCGGAQSVLQL
jgi:MFS family permease